QHPLQRGEAEPPVGQSRPEDLCEAAPPIAVPGCGDPTRDLHAPKIWRRPPWDQSDSVNLTVTTSVVVTPLYVTLTVSVAVVFSFLSSLDVRFWVLTANSARPDPSVVSVAVRFGSDSGPSSSGAGQRCTEMRSPSSFAPAATTVTVAPAIGL